MNSAKRRNASLLAAAVGAALGAWSPIALGAGFSLTEQNASGLGNAFAGAAAAAEDASTIYFNPAGMTRIKGRQVVGVLSLVTPSIKFSDDGSSTVPGVGLPGVPPLQTQGGGNGGDAGGVNVVPAGYLSWEVQPNKLWLGVGFGSPFGLSTEWGAGWIGRFHAIESTVEALTINPSIAWKVSEQMSLGAGLSIQQMKATLSNAVPYSALAFGSGLAAGGPAGASAALAAVGGPGKEGVATVEGDSWAYGWNLGGMFQVTPATRLGVAYRSTISHELEGDIDFANRPAALGGALPDGSVKSDVKLPDTFSIALAHDLDARWQLLADYSWTGWSSIPELAIQRTSGQPVSTVKLAFKNTNRFGVGANYRYDDKWTLRFGLAYDETPVQDADRTPRLPDSSRVWTSVGAQWRMNPQTVFDFGFAYLWISDGSSDLTTASGGTLRGTYESSTWILGAQARYNF